MAFDKLLVNNVIIYRLNIFSSAFPSDSWSGPSGPELNRSSTGPRQPDSCSFHYGADPHIRSDTPVVSHS